MHPGYVASPELLSGPSVCLGRVCPQRFPFGFAFARLGGSPAGRRSAGFQAVESDGISKHSTVYYDDTRDEEPAQFHFGSGGLIEPVLPICYTQRWLKQMLREMDHTKQGGP